MLLELIVAIGLIVGVLTLFTLSITQFAGQSDVLLTRQQAMMAAEAVLNEVRNGNQPAPEAFAARFVDMTVEVSRKPGKGQWRGLTHVIVSVATTAHERTPIRVSLGGYIREVRP